MKSTVLTKMSSNIQLKPMSHFCLFVCLCFRKNLMILTEQTFYIWKMILNECSVVEKLCNRGIVFKWLPTISLAFLYWNFLLLVGQHLHLWEVNTGSATHHWPPVVITACKNCQTMQKQWGHCYRLTKHVTLSSCSRGGRESCLSCMRGRKC